MADTFSKRQREKRKRRRKEAKAERKRLRKMKGRSTDEFMYVDAFGNLTSTPPDPSKKVKIKAKDIEVSIPKAQRASRKDRLLSGIVKFFNRNKNYGFIESPEDNTDYFVHQDNLVDDIRENDRVLFELDSSPKGPVAVQVQLDR